MESVMNNASWHVPKVENIVIKVIELKTDVILSPKENARRQNTQSGDRMSDRWKKSEGEPHPPKQRGYEQVWPSMRRH